MLVLTRDLQNEIKIGDSITITVLSVNGTKVRLGIDAPKSVPVHRREVYDEIVRQQLSAKRPA